jgi:predicted amino acid dehydrogenase
VSLRFGFVVHPLSSLQLSLIAVRTLQPRLFLRLGGSHGRVARFPRVRSPSGAATSGEVRSIPLGPESMLRDQERAVREIVEAARRLAADGAGIVGLGSLCAVVGSRGEDIAKGSPVPVTTGVSFTAFAAAQTLRRVAEALGERIDASTTVAIAGFPGTLATGIAELLSGSTRLVLVGEGRKPMERIAERLRVESGGGASIEVADDAGESVKSADFVLGASSTGGGLAPYALLDGAVVIDVAEPRDLPRSVARRARILVVDGENVSVPPGFLEGSGFFTRFYNWVIRQRHATVYACFAEPIVLALEGRAESFSLGRAVTRDKAEEIGRLGEKHGFRVDKLLHAGRPITPEKLRAIAALRRERVRRETPLAIAGGQS